MRKCYECGYAAAQQNAYILGGKPQGSWIICSTVLGYWVATTPREHVSAHGSAVVGILFCFLTEKEKEEGVCAFKWPALFLFLFLAVSTGNPLCPPSLFGTLNWWNGTRGTNEKAAPVIRGKT